jgi:hypothetical protein
MIEGAGGADDSAVFNAALAAAVDVYIPPGTYHVNNVRVMGGGTLRGAGMERTILKSNGLGPVIYANNPRFRVENLTIDGNGQSVGFSSDGTGNGFSNFAGELERVEIKNCTYGAKIVGGNIFTARNCAFNACTQAQLRLDAAHWFSVIGCDFEQSQSRAIECVNVTSHGGLAPSGGLIEGCWFEALTADYAITNGLYSVTIRNCKFLTPNAVVAVHVAAGADYTSIERNNFQSVGTHAVQVDATATNTLISHNRGITTYAGSSTPGVSDSGTATRIEGTTEAGGAVSKAPVHAFSDKSGACAWNSGYLQLGAYRVWVDANGKLRIKNGAVASDTDGTVVGAQS